MRTPDSRLGRRSGRPTAPLRFAIVALLSFSWSEPGLAAHPVWGANGYQPHLVTIPAQALPPGPAMLQVLGFTAGIPLFHRIEVSAATETLVRSWALANGYGPVELTVIVRSASGAQWSTEISWERDPSPDLTPIFVGTSEDFAWFASIASPSPAATGYLRVGNPHPLRYLSPDDARARGCSFVSEDRKWIAMRANRELVEALLSCVARGADLLLIQDGPGSALSQLDAETLYPWGLGRVATAVPEAEAAATGFRRLFEEPSVASALAEFFAEVGGPRSETLRVHRPFDFPAAPLILFALVIAPVGFLAARRSREPWVAWTWLPGLALLAAGVVWIWSAAGAPARDARLIRLSIEGPGTPGFDSQALWLNAPSSARFAARVPWHGGDIVQAGRTQRFGSPFRRRYPGIEITQTADGRGIRAVGLGRGTPASLVERRVGQAPLLRLERRPDGYWVENLASRPLDRLVLYTKHRAAELEDLAAGERRLLELTSSTPRWRTKLAGAPLPEGAFLLLARFAEDAETLAEFRVEPELPRQAARYVVQTGPLPVEVTPR